MTSRDYVYTVKAIGIRYLQVGRYTALISPRLWLQLWGVRLVFCRTVKKAHMIYSAQKELRRSSDIYYVFENIHDKSTRIGSNNMFFEVLQF